MARRTWHTFCVISLLFTILSLVGDVLSNPATPWYENLPAVTMDYKVHIDAGKEDCYYQYVQPGATFYASYQVNDLISHQYHIFLALNCEYFMTKLLSIDCVISWSYFCSFIVVSSDFHFLFPGVERRRWHVRVRGAAPERTDRSPLWMAAKRRIRRSNFLRRILRCLHR